MKFISGVLKFFSILMLCLVILLLPLSLFARNVGEVLFSRNGITEIIEENLFDEEVLATLAEDMLKTSTVFESDPEEPSPYLELVGSALEKLDHDTWVEIIDTITPADLISNTFYSIFTGFYDWLDNDEPLPNIVINLRPWKRNTIQNATPVMGIILDVFPDCTAEQIGAYVINFGLNLIQVSEVPSIPLCKPTEPFYSLIVEKGIGIIPSMAEKIPDEVNLANQFEETIGDLFVAKQTLKSARFILQWSWAIVFLLFLVALLMGARTFPQLFKWAVWPIILSAGIVLVFVFSLNVIAPWIISRFTLEYLTDVPGTLGATFTTIISALLFLFVAPLRNQGLILLLVGILLIVLGYVIGSVIKKRKSEPDLSDQMRIPGVSTNILSSFPTENQNQTKTIPDPEFSDEESEDPLN